MRNMSFSLTTRQMRARSKTVTRRIGWWFLKPGDVVMAVEKGRGLKKGEKVKRIHAIRIISTWEERLFCCDNVAEIEAEGFPGTSPVRFVQDFCKQHRGCTARTVVNRIKFEHL